MADTRCKVCVHDQRGAIDEALVAGTSVREVARQFDLDHSTVGRHAAAHVAQALALAHDRLELADARSLAVTFNELYAKAHELLARCEAEGDTRGAIVALREVVAIVDIGARVAATVAAAAYKAPGQISIRIVYDQLTDARVARDGPGHARPKPVDEPETPDEPPKKLVN